MSLVQALNADKTAYVGAADFVFNNTDAQPSLTSLTVSGNGTAEVTNAGAAKLVSVDASGLNSVTFDGKAADGLTYSSTNAAAETIKLGAGIDHISLGNSTYGAADTITGLHLVLDATGKALDASSDTIKVGGFTAFKVFTTSQTDLDLALKDAAASADDNLVFQLGGNTYVYHDAAATGGTTGTTGTIEATDTLVKLTGQVNLDALQVALG